MSTGDYEQAVSKYLQAEANMKKEISLVRAKCAQACLKQKLFKDAYIHSCECINLDKTNHEGYYRRAQALKDMLPVYTEFGCYKDVVKNYLACYKLKPIVEAFAQAVLLAVKHGKLTLVLKD